MICKTAVVVGSAQCVFEDLAKLQALLPDRKDYIVFSVNFASMLPIKPNYIVGMHGAYIDTYKNIACIKAEEFGWIKNFYTVSSFGHADYVYKDLGGDGTSGRFAVDVALKLRFKKILLCGVPIDGTDRFYGDIKHDYAPLINYKEWTEQDNSKVRSFSGNTKKLLGEPTEAWLTGGKNE